MTLSPRGALKLYRRADGVLLVADGQALLLDDTWDDLFNRHELASYLRDRAAREQAAAVRFDPDDPALMAPIASQEVWAAGVTYYRSRDARMEEAQEASGGDFYARVYTAERPELFFKTTAHRVVGNRGAVRIRKDSAWNVPEPELALAINSAGEIFGYAICNDMSSRDIEGENPLYLPQAKTYDGCCALGPCLLIAEEQPAPSTVIDMVIRRGRETAFAGSTTLDQLKRTPGSLVEWLYREASFPQGCFLSTGTGVVPPPEFTLHSGDEIQMTIEPIGMLVNRVE